MILLPHIRDNCSPSYILEMLTRITKVFKDYCGVLSEESIRVNFVLIYELLDEILDFGYVQDTSTELLKAYVFNEPVIMAKSKGSNFRVGAQGGISLFVFVPLVFLNVRTFQSIRSFS